MTRKAESIVVSDSTPSDVTRIMSSDCSTSEAQLVVRRLDADHHVFFEHALGRWRDVWRIVTVDPDAMADMAAREVRYALALHGRNHLVEQLRDLQAGLTIS